MTDYSGPLDWMFRNRQTGTITIGQSANLPIKVFQGSTLLGVLVARGRPREVLAEVSVVSLVVWAVAEITTGVNPFRRVTGAIALASLAALTARGARDLPRSVSR